jgi:type VI protein secretion system component VasF
MNDEEDPIERARRHQRRQTVVVAIVAGVVCLGSLTWFFYGHFLELLVTVSLNRR